jgi:hypothetical protein
VVGILVAELVRVEEGVAEKAGAAGSQHVLVHRLLQVIQQLAQLTLPSHASNLNRGTLTVRHRNVYDGLTKKHCRSKTRAVAEVTNF